MSAPADPVGFCRDLQDRLLGSMVLFCGDVALAEELTQEALARALERWDRVGRMAAPEAWVYRTALNLGRSWFRRRSVERRALERSGVAVQTLPDSAEAVAVRQAVLSLPRRQRAAIVARYYAGLTIEEAAGALGCAPGTVKALTHKAIRRLRAEGLADDEEVEADVASE